MLLQTGKQQGSLLLCLFLSPSPHCIFKVGRQPRKCNMSAQGLRSQNDDVRHAFMPLRPVAAVLSPTRGSFKTAECKQGTTRGLHPSPLCQRNLFCSPTPRPKDHSEQPPSSHKKVRGGLFMVSRSVAPAIRHPLFHQDVPLLPRRFPSFQRVVWASTLAFSPLRVLNNALRQADGGGFDSFTFLHHCWLNGEMT